jgi:xanthine dehydrogenase YagT iron-sulfur-binding subunit
MKKERRRKKTGASESGGVSRRDFLTTTGLGAVGLAAAGGAAPASAEGDPAAPEMIGSAESIPIKLRINGRTHSLLAEARWSLLYVLREELGLTGSKEGCHRGECGSCTVLIDDEPRYACTTLAIEAEGKEITTLEGLLEGEDLGAVQQAFVEKDAYQCGYCTPGQVMAVEGLLRANPNPSLDEIRTGVSGNLCRCGAYVNIFKAAGRAAEIKRGKGAGR